MALACMNGPGICVCCHGSSQRITCPAHDGIRSKLRVAIKDIINAEPPLKELGEPDFLPRIPDAEPDVAKAYHEAMEEIDKQAIQLANPITQPAHYNNTAITALQVIDDWQLNFRVGNAVKYIARHTRKGNPIEDLQKAVEYLQLEIARLSKKPATALKRDKNA